MAGNDKGKLLYQEKVSDYFLRKYTTLLLIIMICFVIISYNYLSITSGAYGSRYNVNIGVIITFGFIGGIYLIYFFSKEEILSSRFKIFENGITPFNNHDFINFKNVVGLAFVKRRYKGAYQFFGARIIIYIGDKRKAEEIPKDQELMDNFLEECDNNTMRVNHFTDESLNELLKTLLKQGMLDENTYFFHKSDLAGYTRKISWM